MFLDRLIGGIEDNCRKIYIAEKNHYLLLFEVMCYIRQK